LGSQLKKKGVCGSTGLFTAVSISSPPPHHIKLREKYKPKERGVKGEKMKTVKSKVGKAGGVGGLLGV